jgi:hypothetical protein
MDIRTHSANRGRSVGHRWIDRAGDRIELAVVMVGVLL